MRLDTEIIKEYLKEWNNLPSLTLARKIYADNAEVFKNVEAVRSTIRYYRGRAGYYNRQKIIDTSFAEEYNKYTLPETEAEDYDDFILEGPKKILIFSDVHVPYHDIGAISLMFDYAKDREYTDILINGDFWDFHQMSYFQKDPRKRHTKGELDTGKAFLTKLREVFPTQKIYFKIGNHEERWESYLMNKAPELFDMHEFRLEEVFPFLDLGIETVSDKRIIKAGKLNILHGHELQLKGVTVNPARSTFLKTYQNTLVGHLHKPSEHTEKNLGGEVVSCWSTGCMCWMHPHYAPINKWSHGFASVKLEESGNFSVKNKKIIEGEIL